MEMRDRLKSGRGNAMLVSGSIYSACRFFDLFQQTDLADKCAIVTSYRPTSADIKGEETGEGRDRKDDSGTAPTGRCWRRTSTSRKKRRCTKSSASSRK